MAPQLSKRLPLNCGDTVIDCAPLIHVLTQEFKSFYCDHCLVKNVCLKKCSTCQQMYYCDRDCQRRDWKYHKLECKIYSTANYDPTTVLWRERLTLRLWLAVKANPKIAAKKHRLFDGSSVSLMDIAVPVNDMRHDIDRMVSFRLLCNHFQSYALKFDREELLRWYGLVSTNACCNPILYYGDNQFCVPIAIGIYAQTSLLRHSCCPNAAIISNGVNLEVRAMKRIECNEDVTISYIDLAMSKLERQELLKSLYYIECKCDKCALDSDSSVDYTKFKSLYQQIMHDSSRLRASHYSVAHDWKRSHLAGTQMVPIYRQIYGDYYPQLTLILMLFFDTAVMNDEESNENIVALYHQVVKSIKVTHGENHELFRQFQMFSKQMNTRFISLE